MKAYSQLSLIGLFLLLGFSWGTAQQLSPSSPLVSPGAPLGSNAMPNVGPNTIPAENPFKNCGAPEVSEVQQQQIDSIQEQLKDDPQNPFLYYNLGRLLYRGQQWKEAQAAFASALAYDKDQQLADQIYYNLGNVHACQQEFEQAVKQYKQTVQRNPEDVDARYNLSLARLLAQQQQQQQQQQQGDGEQQQGSEGQQGEQGESQQAENQDGQQGEQEEQQANQQQQQQNGQQGEQEEQQAQAGQQNQEEAEQEEPSDATAGGQQESNESESEDSSVAAAQETPQSEGPLPEGGAEDQTDLLLSKQQAEQVLNAVQENRRNFIQRLIQRQGKPRNPPDKNW